MIDFIEIDNKTDRDLLVAVITKQNTSLEVQHEINQRLKTQNGTIAKLVTDLATLETKHKTHNHKGLIIALVAPIAALLGVVLNCLL
jgi:hypothetical protein